MFKQTLRRWLADPDMSGLDLDDPATTILRRELIRRKPFLSRVYREWYGMIAGAIPASGGPVLEIGSGGGFLAETIDPLITSEVFYSPHVQTILDGCRLPFAGGSLGAIAMVDVFHHLSQPRAFLKEASRCVKSGGRIVMVEPWVSPWSRLIYRNLHHEPFLPEKAEWEFETSGPLSGANDALPWIVFARDRGIFTREFPEWQVRRIEPMMPFRYLVSGGVSMRSLAPGWSYGLWGKVESLLRPWMQAWAMFALIVLQKSPITDH